MGRCAHSSHLHAIARANTDSPFRRTFKSGYNTKNKHPSTEESARGVGRLACKIRILQFMRAVGYSAALKKATEGSCGALSLSHL